MHDGRAAFRHVAALMALSFVLAACGSRLTDEQRQVAIGAQPAAGSAAQPGAATDAGGSGSGAGGGEELTFSTDGDTASTGASAQETGTTGGDAAGSDPGGGSDGGASDGGSSPGTSGDGGGEGDAAPGDGGSADGGQSGGTGAPQDTRQAPPGGNGGATDVGVTADSILLSNVSDISGAVPGLFEPSQLAAKAYLKFFEVTEGTLFGRRLEYLPLDTGMSTRGNRNGSIEACDRSFASIGSTSAFDQGGAPVIDECEIPDIRGLSTTAQMKAVDNAFPTDAITARVEPIGAYRWIKDQYPEAVEDAAYLFIAGEVTEQSTGRTRDATSRELGYEWDYVQPIEISETNYSPFVVEMKDRGIEYVTFQGAYQQGVRLAQAMEKQGFEPTVYQLQSNAYQRKFLEQGGDSVEGVFIAISSVMVEEMDQHPELQNYAKALEAVAPGARPTSLGMYAWSASKLFVEIAKKIGPELTREKVLAELAKVEDWTGGGLHPPEDVSGRWPSACFIMTQVSGGSFTRVHPQQGFDCDGPTVDLR